MCNRNVIRKKLLIAGLVAMLCTWGLAAEQSAQTRQTPGQQQPGTQQQDTQQQRTQQPGAQQPGMQPPQTQQPGMQPQRPGTQPQRPQAGQPMRLQRTSELIGRDVRNRQGENLGNIHDIVLTQDHQRVAYVALARGGIWGIGANFFAIPWEAVEIGAGNEVFVPITEQQLEAAEGFDRDNWPAQGDQRWAAGATRPGQMREPMGQTTPPPGTGTQPRAGQTTEREPLVQRGRDSDRVVTRPRDDVAGRGMAVDNREVQQRRVTNLTGMDVRNAAGENIADIEDFVIDAQSGQVAYTVVSFGGFWGIGERYAAVPHSAIQLQPQRNVARLEADRQTLEAVAFEGREFPNLADREYAQRLHDTFKAEPYWIYGFVPGEQQQQAAQRAWGPEGSYAKHFDAQNVRTIKGKVQSVGTFQPDEEIPGVADGLRLRVATEDGSLLTVHAGPRSYAQQEDFFPRPGDEISITGSETKIGWRSVFLASQIQKGDQTLQLRDQTGRPLWSGQPGQQMQQRGAAGQRQQPGAATGQRQPGQTGTQTRPQ
jgi:sporulation protein YlmC with PRC-barrel domain